MSTSILVESLEIERFRGIRRGAIAGLSQVNVLVGRNNAGKTTILEALLLCVHQAAKGASDLLARSRLKMIFEGRAEGGTVPASWRYRRERTLPVKIVLGLRGGLCTLTIPTEDLQPEASFAGEKGGEAIAALARATLFNARHATSGEFEGRLWPDVVARRGDLDLTRALNELFDLGADGFQFLPNGYLMATFPTYAARVDDQGDGTRLAFRLLLLVSQLSDTALLIEELETCQHPAALEKLCRALAKAAALQRVQLFITTHSRECLLFMLRAAEAEGLGATAIHTALDAGELKTRVIPASSVLGMDSSGTDVRFLDLYG